MTLKNRVVTPPAAASAPASVVAHGYSSQGNKNNNGLCVTTSSSRSSLQSSSPSPLPPPSSLLSSWGAFHYQVHPQMTMSRAKNQNQVPPMSLQRKLSSSDDQAINQLMERLIIWLWWKSGKYSAIQNITLPLCLPHFLTLINTDTATVIHTEGWIVLTSSRRHLPRLVTKEEIWWIGKCTNCLTNWY